MKYFLPYLKDRFYTKIYFNRKINKKYKDIVKNYKEYLNLQINDFASFESENPRFNEGQIKYLDKYFSKIPRETFIADIACGDGAGLRQFKKMGFKNVVGADINKKKLIKCRKTGYPLYLCDMHNLKSLKDNRYDIVYSSHTLEHAYNPATVISGFRRILKPKGKLYLVLPYPDYQYFNLMAHGAKFELGLNINDKGKTLISFITNLGFSLLSKEFNNYREPEIWLCFRKKICPQGSITKYW